MWEEQTPALLHQHTQCRRRSADGSRMNLQAVRLGPSLHPGHLSQEHQVVQEGGLQTGLLEGPAVLGAHEDQAAPKDRTRGMKNRTLSL